jgi:hypothetical protein
MELPVPNGSMQHREPKSEIDDTCIMLQGASCTIAACHVFWHGVLLNLGLGLYFGDLSFFSLQSNIQDLGWEGRFFTGY